MPSLFQHIINAPESVQHESEWEGKECRTKHHLIHFETTVPKQSSLWSYVLCFAGCSWKKPSDCLYSYLSINTSIKHAEAWNITWNTERTDLIFFFLIYFFRRKTCSTVTILTYNSGHVWNTQQATLRPCQVVDFGTWCPRWQQGGEHVYPTVKSCGFESHLGVFLMFSTCFNWLVTNLEYSRLSPWSLMGKAAAQASFIHCPIHFILKGSRGVPEPTPAVFGQ